MSLDLGFDVQARTDLEFIYVGDPMCSWCWGFSPALEQMGTRYAIGMRVVMGGLRTGAQAQPMDAEARRQLADYWRGVEARTGQPFTTAALERGDWSYDTEPSCRAVVAMRELAPDETLRWVARLHRAFYVEGVDITDLAVFSDLVDGFDVDLDRFTEMLTDQAIIEQTRQDFAEAQRFGASGFPTVLFRDGNEVGVVTRGFVPWEQLEPALTRWLEDRYGDLTAGLVCDPETGFC
jgi:putative protein-disulfide isomerase